MPTPSWLAARNGLPGDSNAVDKSAQINQLLGAHGVTPLYSGNQIITPNGQSYIPGYCSAFQWIDHAQPFVMSGTTIGRVTLPLVPVGNGADLVMSLYTDSGGVPGTLVASTRLPAKWMTTFAATRGTSTGPATGSISTFNNYIVSASQLGQLAVPSFNTLETQPLTSVPWASPTGSASGSASNPSSVMAGNNYLVLLGGADPGSGDPVPNVYTIGYAGGQALGNAVPQPPLPSGTNHLGAAATPTSLVVAGGLVTPTSDTDAVYVAGWNPTTGEVSAWSSQATLPQNLYNCSAASWNNTVYVVGGHNYTGGVALNTLYYATVNNGQISSWQAGQPLPLTLELPNVAVVGNFLIVAGGLNGASTYSSAVYYAPIAADGTPGSWFTGPSLPIPIQGAVQAVTANGLVLIGGYTTGATVNGEIQTITWSDRGPGLWQTRGGTAGEAVNPSAVFPNGTGTWQHFSITATSYNTRTIGTANALSVPFPVSGLTNGATYHLVFHMANGDLNNWFAMDVDFHAIGTHDTLYRAIGGSTWAVYTSGYSMPLTIFGRTAGGPVLHTWEDSGNRITTLVNATTPDVRLLGLAEATQFADSTMLAEAAALTYPGTWPAGAWPPLGVTQL